MDLAILAHFSPEILASSRTNDTSIEDRKYVYSDVIGFVTKPFEARTTAILTCMRSTASSNVFGIWDRTHLRGSQQLGDLLSRATDLESGGVYVWGVTESGYFLRHANFLILDLGSFAFPNTLAPLGRAKAIANTRIVFKLRDQRQGASWSSS